MTPEELRKLGLEKTADVLDDHNDEWEDAIYELLARIEELSRSNTAMRGTIGSQTAVVNLTEGKLRVEKQRADDAESALQAADQGRLDRIANLESKLTAAEERVRESQSALLTVREVAERITQEGNTTPLDPMWLYERMCEVIEVIDAARLTAPEPKEEK